MKITTNYTHLIHKSRKLITTPVANTSKLLQKSETTSNIQTKSLYLFLKQTYNTIKNFIFKPQTYDEIPPLPKKIENVQSTQKQI